jgi:hypothetical protein
LSLIIYLTIFRKRSFFLQGTNFCGSAENRRRPLSELLYNIVMGFVGIFEYLHLKDGPTRLKYLFYYALTSVEAAALMTLWYLDTTTEVSKKDKIQNLLF